jgi:hypothetical protein
MRNEGERLLYLRGKGYMMPEKGYAAQPDNGTDFAFWWLYLASRGGFSHANNGYSPYPHIVQHK